MKLTQTFTPHPTDPTQWAEWLDPVGNPIKVGDIVAVAITGRGGAGADLRIGEVVRINSHNSKGNAIGKRHHEWMGAVPPADADQQTMRDHHRYQREHPEQYQIKFTPGATIKLRLTEWKWDHKTQKYTDAHREHTFQNIHNVVKIDPPAGWKL